MKMYKMSIIFLFAILALLACGNGKTDSRHATVGQTDEKPIYYTCPMETHKHIHAGQPGTCEECGMTLVQAVVTSPENREFYGCPMEEHSHVRQAEPGVCEDCGMTLEPMRLKKN